MTKSFNDKNKQRRMDDSVFSKNHSKSVRYRIRIQQDREAQEEIEIFLFPREEDVENSSDLPRSFLFRE